LSTFGAGPGAAPKITPKTNQVQNPHHARITVALLVLLLLGAVTTAASFIGTKIKEVSAIQIGSSTQGVVIGRGLDGERYNTQYVYLTAGEHLRVTSTIMSYSDDRTGSIQYTAAPQNFRTNVYRPNATTPDEPTGRCNIANGSAYGTSCTINYAAPMTGTYRIQTYNDATPVNIRSDRPNNGNMNYQITVSSAAGAEIHGRIWTERMTSIEVGSRDLRIWSVDEAGYINQIDLRQMNCGWCHVDFTAVGNVDPALSCKSSYISTGRADDLSLSNPNDPATNPQRAGGCSRAKLFYELPSTDLPRDVLPVAAHSPGDSPSSLVPIAESEKDFLVSGLSFAPDVDTNIKSGSIRFSLWPNLTGNFFVKAFRDANQNGSIDDDDGAPLRTIRLSAEDWTGTLSFDGLDDNNNPIPVDNQIIIRVELSRLGEMHLRLVDFEGLAGGQSVVKINGAQRGDATLYWDDSRLVMPQPGVWGTPFGGTNPFVSNGIDSRSGVHGWSSANNTANMQLSWGDTRSIDSWAYTITGIHFDTGGLLPVVTDTCYDED
jgi:hypothetical protein